MVIQPVPVYEPSEANASEVDCRYLSFGDAVAVQLDSAARTQQLDPADLVCIRADRLG